MTGFNLPQDAIDAAKGFSLPKEAIDAANPGVLGTAEDAAKSVGSGALRGVGELADIPVSTWNLGQYGINAVRKLAGYSPMEDHTGDASYFRKGMENLTGGASEYKPTTTLGKYAGTVGEFIPGAIGAALTGGESLVPAIGKGILTSIIPGAASEAAGEATVGTKWEPVARAGAAILGGKLSSMGEAALRPEAAIQSGLNPEAANFAADMKTLQDNKIQLPAGIRTRSPEVQAIEASTPQGASLYGQGLNRQYTASAIADHLKGEGTIANPATVEKAGNLAGTKIRNIMGKVDTVADPSTASDFNSFVDDYKATHGAVAPSTIRGFNDFLLESYTTGKKLDPDTLWTFRREFGNAISHDYAPQIDEAYKKAFNTVDGIISQYFTHLGTPQAIQDLEELQKARMDYRNYLVIKHALPTAQNGILDPAKVANSMIAVLGRDTYATANNNPLVNLTRAANNVFDNSPKTTVSTSGVNTINRIGNSALGMSLAQKVDPMTLALTHGAAWGLGKAEKAGMNAMHRFYAGKTGQRVLTNLHTPNTLTQLTGKAPLVSGLNSAFQDRQGRKTGGRVSTHDVAADQLVRAAERAKKGQSAQTEALLQQPDNAVAHALEVANRSI